MIFDILHFMVMVFLWKSVWIFSRYRNESSGSARKCDKECAQIESWSLVIENWSLVILLDL